MDINSIDGIAFTRGPGMVSCLNVGANAAKTLAAALNKPIVGVHHMVVPDSFLVYPTRRSNHHLFSSKHMP
jgi:tRNA A37 threonylcarbamoyladenosine modification protein TsaB